MPSFCRSNVLGRSHLHQRAAGAHQENPARIPCAYPQAHSRGSGWPLNAASLVSRPRPTNASPHLRNVTVRVHTPVQRRQGQEHRASQFAVPGHHSTSSPAATLLHPDTWLQLQPNPTQRQPSLTQPHASAPLKELTLSSSMGDAEHSKLCAILRRCAQAGEGANLSAEERLVLTKLQLTFRENLERKRRAAAILPVPFAPDMMAS